MNKLVAAVASLVALLLVGVAGVTAANSAQENLTDDNKMDARAGESEGEGPDDKQGKRHGPRGPGCGPKDLDRAEEIAGEEGQIPELTELGARSAEGEGEGPTDSQMEQRGPDDNERKGKPDHCHKGKRGGERGGEERDRPLMERVNLSELDPEMVEALETLKAFMDEYKESLDNATGEGDDNDTGEQKPPRFGKHREAHLLMDLLKQLEESAAEIEEETEEPPVEA